MKLSKKLKVSFILLALSTSCTVSNQNNTDPNVTASIRPSPVISASSSVISSPTPMVSDNIDPEIKKLNLKGKIVYMTATGKLDLSDTVTEIHIMKADGTNDKTLTKGFYDTDPKLSRDGSKIVFLRRFPTEKHYQYDIFTINIDGLDLRHITNSAFNENTPCFSDDGTKIAYNDSEGIYTINSDGSDEKIIITHRAFEPYYMQRFELIPGSEMPNWYKNKIVFITSPIHYSGGYISIANADGTSMNSIDDIKIIDEFINFNPVWSPDGSKIVYGSGTIYSISSDGSNKKLLATGIDGSSKYPSWSYDGTKISFERNGEIYVMNEDGTNQIKISKGYQPYWSM